MNQALEKTFSQIVRTSENSNGQLTIPTILLRRCMEWAYEDGKLDASRDIRDKLQVAMDEIRVQAKMELDKYAEDVQKMNKRSEPKKERE